MTIELTISALTLVLLSVCAVTLLGTSVFGFRPMRILARHCRRLPEDMPTDDMISSVKVSVIVYTRNVETSVATYIESLMNQRGVDFEVIVVDDASADHTAGIVESLLPKYPNLYMTFVPEDSRSLSRRKLSLTLGMKAAKGDVVVTTAANCIIRSEWWLHHMVSNFSDRSTEIVLGFSHIDAAVQCGVGGRYRAFDSVVEASLWLGYALNHKAYRGDGFNLAFRRKLFFEQNGYARSIYLQHGDDDLFINEIANDKNTVVQLHPHSQLIVDWGDSEKRMWLDRKEHYSFTSHYLKTRAFILSRFSFVSLWIGTVCAVAVLATDWLNLISVIIASLLLLFSWGYQICLYRRVANALGSRRLTLAVPLLMLLKPVCDLIYKISFRRRKSSNFTWSCT